MEYFYRFCPGKSTDIQLQFVTLGACNLKLKDLHQTHLIQAQATGKRFCEVKRNVFFAYDVFEGIILKELAQCLTVLISKKLFTLADLNFFIVKIPYK